MQRQHSLQEAAWAALTLCALLLWDASGLDLPLARAFGGELGFPLRDDMFLRLVLHEGAKVLAWLLAVLLCLGLAWPLGPLRQLPLSRRLQLVISALLAWAIVALLKASSHTSCPWDLHDFGGAARYVSHWQGWQNNDGGGGRCFPAGHAATGFAFVGGFFALREQWPRLARRWLFTALGAGLVLGLAQQLRGAHFMSHTLWTAWICWMAAWVSDPLFARGTVAPVGQAST